MTRDDVLRQYQDGTLKADRKKLYRAMDFLSLPYTKTSCKKCLNDYLNMIGEELGLIGDAAEVSDFNGGSWRYLPDRIMTWNGHIIGQDTPTDVIEKFVKAFPKGYYEFVPENNEQDNTQDEQK